VSECEVLQHYCYPSSFIYFVVEIIMLTVFFVKLINDVIFVSLTDL